MRSIEYMHDVNTGQSLRLTLRLTLRGCNLNSTTVSCLVVI